MNLHHLSLMLGEKIVTRFLCPLWYSLSGFMFSEHCIYVERAVVSRLFASASELYACTILTNYVVIVYLV